MRVTFQAAHREATAAINKASERLMEFQRQVSTNKRVERPSDDPSAASAATVERAQLAGIDRYTEAGNSAESRLTVADTALSDLITQITSAQTTALAVRGSHVTQPQRDAYALEREALRDAMLRDVNTQFRGQYLFGGAAATVAPYTRDTAGVVSAYQASTVEVAVDVHEEHEVQTAFNGEALTRGTDPDDLFVVMDRAIAAARAGNGPVLDTAMADLQRALERATALQSRVGASLRTIADDRSRLSESARAAKAQISTLEDANMAEAISGMTEAETAYRAALGATSKLHSLSLMDYLR
jgi:flagellar hook-associated protein 3 FlgL